MAKNSVLTYEEKVAQVKEILGEIEGGNLELTEVFSRFAIAVESLQQCEKFLSQQCEHVEVIARKLLGLTSLRRFKWRFQAFRIYLVIDLSPWAIDLDSLGNQGRH
jgi:exodeoxyribonuclease VII small subunit